MNKLAIALLLVVWITLATACSYKFGDKTIDLSNVGTIEGVLDVQGDKTEVFVNFCENIKDGKWNMYAVDPSDGDLMSFGSVDAVPLPVAASTGGVNTLTFNNGEANCYNRGYKSRQVVFTLTCGTTSPTFSIAENDCTYAIPLTVDCEGSSASGGLSGGAIFLIIFFSVLAGYFVIGALLCKFVFKKDGLDIIPQRAFWCALPGLFIAGIKYLIGCFTKKSTSTEYSESYGATDEV